MSFVNRCHHSPTHYTPPQFCTVSYFYLHFHYTTIHRNIGQQWSLCISITLTLVAKLSLSSPSTFKCVLAPLYNAPIPSSNCPPTGYIYRTLLRSFVSALSCYIQVFTLPEVFIQNQTDSKYFILDFSLSEPSLLPTKLFLSYFH